MKRLLARALALIVVAASAALAAAEGPPPSTTMPPGVVDLTPATLPGPAAPIVEATPRRPAEMIFSAEYLLAFPRRGNMDFAIPDATNNRTPEGSVQSLDWGASSGVRAALGWRPAGAWLEASFAYSYINGYDQQLLTAPPGGLLYATQTRPGLVDSAASANASARLAYNVFDLTIGRTVLLDNFFSLRWSTGARLAAIYQTLDTTYNGLQADNTRVLDQNTYIGGGLTASGEGRWTLPNNFSLFGHGGAALISGQRTALLQETDHAGATVNANITDQAWQVVPVLELGVGLSWQRDGYSVSVGYEITNWFGLVNRPQFVDDLSDGKFGRRQSDLSVEAVYFRLSKSF